MAKPLARPPRRMLIARALAGTTFPALLASMSSAARQAPPRSREQEIEPAIEKGRLQQASVAWCYGAPLEELAKVTAALGLKGIDVVQPESYPTLKKYGLVCTMTPCMSRGYGIGKALNKKENHEGLMQLVRDQIDASAEAGFRNILVFSGNRQDGLSDKEGLENCAEGLKQVVGYAEEKNQLILMELLNSKRDHKGYMCDRTHWGVELVQKVGSPAFKLLYDIYHMQIQEGDVIATIRENHEHIGHYHTAGVPGRSNLDETQELYYPAIMNAIAETGFDGYVAQEFIPRGDKVEALRQAVVTCDV